MVETTVSSSLAEAWVITLAAIGGVIVLIGLLLEKFSEKKWHKNINDFRRCESRRCWGEWFVMAGILVEIIVAAFSANDAWQTRQMAIKNDPRNATISEISATAILVVNLSNSFEK
jgi:hypothetical protein